jgi:septal ring factor EnvC (AmiA/AmiB activator)
MQETYKKLQKDADVESALERLRTEIKETTVERDRMRIECQNMDLECKNKVDELNRLKDAHNEQAEERKFMEE